MNCPEYLGGWHLFFKVLKLLRKYEDEVVFADHVELVFGLAFNERRIFCLLNLHIQDLGLSSRGNDLFLNCIGVVVQTPNSPDGAIEK